MLEEKGGLIFRGFIQSNGEIYTESNCKADLQDGFVFKILLFKIQPNFKFLTKQNVSV